MKVPSPLSLSLCWTLCYASSTLSADKLIQRVSTEHAQLQHSIQVAMETLQQERDELQRQLQSQVRRQGTQL